LLVRNSSKYNELLILKNAKYIFRIEGDNNTAKYHVTLGIYNRCVKETTRRTFAVTNVVINPNFTSPTGNYDVAIITLNQTTDYTPICLPEEGKGQGATRLC
jgi:Trypsin.